MKRPVGLRVLLGIFTLAREARSAPRASESPQTAATQTAAVPGEALMHLTALLNKNCAVREGKKRMRERIEGRS